MSQPKKKSAYISASESRRITRFNRRITKKLENARADANKDPALYTTRMKDENNVVEFDNVCTYFFSEVGTVKAVDGVNFSVPKHATVGICGESGCGKSVTSLSLMQLLQRPSGQVVGGEIRFNKGDGTAYNIVNTPNAIMEHIRGNKISMIFQEPMTSLNPVFKIGEQVDEVTKLHHPEMAEAEVKARTLEMLDLVGIANKEGVYDMYPHELSGGMRQRICIAIALACSPTLIIADEPTTALDVTIQAQILDLLQDLKDKLNSSIMLITHDLGVVAGMADYVVIMYAGRVVEKGTADEIFHHPAHPYTIGLFNSIPNIKSDAPRLSPINGMMPDPTIQFKGCRFAERCARCTERCENEKPPFVDRDGHQVRCFLYAEESDMPDETEVQAQ